MVVIMLVQLHDEDNLNSEECFLSAGLNSADTMKTRLINDILMFLIVCPTSRKQQHRDQRTSWAQTVDRRSQNSEIKLFLKSFTGLSRSNYPFISSLNAAFLKTDGVFLVFIVVKFQFQFELLFFFPFSV